MSNEIRALHRAFDEACADLTKIKDRYSELTTMELQLQERLALVVKEKADLKRTILQREQEIEKILNQIPLTQLTPESSQNSSNLSEQTDEDSPSMFLTQAPSSSSIRDPSDDED